jgi:hypothetical protein
MWQKKCINSNAENSRRIERNQKLFGELIRPLFSFHLNVLSMDSAVLSTKLSRIEIGDRIFEIQKNSLNFHKQKLNIIAKYFTRYSVLVVSFFRAVERMDGPR